MIFRSRIILIIHLLIFFVCYGASNLRAQYMTQIPYESDSTFYRVDLAIKASSRCAYLFLEYDSIKTLADNFSLLTQLRGITFKYCNQVDWSQAFGILSQMPRLEFLEISVCKINKLNDRINKLKKLRSLVLKTNNFLTIPESVLELTKLRYVNLSFNPGMKWDEVLARIPVQVTEIDLSGNNLVDLPLQVCKFTNLKKLHLQGNYLKSLPASFVELTELTNLNLNNNRVMNWKTAFESILKLKKLSILKISNNELTELPTKIGTLTELTELYADGNQLKSLPESIGSLTNLVTLNISTSITGQTRNQIEKFPLSFSKLVNIEVLNMSGTYMMSLPVGIDRMIKLKKLYIDWCGLVSLNEIKNCKQLEELYASHNYFDRIPDWIGGLASIRVLILDGNYFPNKAIPHILQCPASIGLLSNLESFSLNDQLIDKLPDEIGNLKKLKTLNLRNNKLEALPPSLSQCTALETLNLKANLLKSIPDLNGLSSLKELNLSFNPDLNIDTYAGKFSKLAALQKIDLSYNNISKNTLEALRAQYPTAEIIYFSTNDLKFNPDKKN